MQFIPVGPSSHSRFPGLFLNKESEETVTEENLDECAKENLLLTCSNYFQYTLNLVDCYDALKHSPWSTL